MRWGFDIMRDWRCIYLTFIVLAALKFATPALAENPTAPPALQLLSLVNLPIKTGQYISQFEVDSWAVEIIAVCKIPAGWDVGGGTDGSPGGTLHGMAGVGTAYLADPNARQLWDIFLVKAEEFRPEAITGTSGTQYPATFAGKINIGYYGSSNRHETIKLKPNNFALRPASQCPPLTTR